MACTESSEDNFSRVSLLLPLSGFQEQNSDCQACITHHLAVLSRPGGSNLPSFSDVENMFYILVCTLLFPLVNFILYLFETF